MSVITLSAHHNIGGSSQCSQVRTINKKWRIRRKKVKWPLVAKNLIIQKNTRKYTNNGNLGEFSKVAW